MRRIRDQPTQQYLELLSPRIGLAQLCTRGDLEVLFLSGNTLEEFRRDTGTLLFTYSPLSPAYSVRGGLMLV